jgi:hypothetical protein
MDHRFRRTRNQLSTFHSQTAPRHDLPPMDYVRKGNLFFSTEADDVLLPQVIDLCRRGQHGFRLGHAARRPRALRGAQSERAKRHQRFGEAEDSRAQSGATLRIAALARLMARLDGRKLAGLYGPCCKHTNSQRLARKEFSAMRKFSPLLFACLFFSAHHPAFAQDAKLVEAAKKEGGKVVFYTTMEVFTLDAVKAAFEKKTGIQVDYWRAGLTDVLARALSEYRAGKPIMDVIGIPGDYMQIMANDGALAKYDSPSFKGFAKDAVDPLLGARYRNILFGRDLQQE